MKTIKEFFPNHTLKDKYDLELQQFTADDIEAYAIHVLKSLAEECETMFYNTEDGNKYSILLEEIIQETYAVPKQTIINKINKIW